MSLQILIPIVLKASVLLTVFAIGLRASVPDATYLFRRPGELVRALLAMNVAVPLFAIVLISIFDLTPAVEIAIVALSVSPIPPLLPNKMVKAGGNDSYALDYSPRSVDLPTNKCIEEVVKLFKGSSSHWINENRLLRGRFSWGRGYGAFSVSHSDSARVANYIARQEDHHSKKTFNAEFQLFVKKYGLEWRDD